VWEGITGKNSLPVCKFKIQDARKRSLPVFQLKKYKSKVQIRARERSKNIIVKVGKKKW
jgi:hypothetical protein